MREINRIVVHCSATREGQDIDMYAIRKWHTDEPPRGRGWSDIGYHAVVTLDGVVQAGRPVEEIGAHAAGHNTGSLAICYVGGLDVDGQTPKDTRTDAQKAALKAKVLEWMRSYDVALEDVVGHNELPGVKKACPCFDMTSFRAHLIPHLALEDAMDEPAALEPLLIDLPTLWPNKDGSYPDTAAWRLLGEIFGGSTSADVQVFQSLNGLKPDGIIGPRTWGVMLESTGGAR